MTRRLVAALPGAPLAVLLALALAGCRQPVAVAPFAAPAAVVHDDEADVYLVANVVGDPLAKDNNGRIARLRPDGSVLAADFIAGGQRGVELHAPRGLCLHGEVLWVADLDVLRRFDRRSGRPLAEVPIPGASLLYGLAAAPDGTIYATDTGWTVDPAAGNSAAVWQIGADLVPQQLAAGPELGQPTGIVALATGIYVVGWRDGSFYLLDRKGQRTELLRAPAAELAGLVRIPGGDGRPPSWLASSLQGSCLYRFDLQGGAVALPRELPQPGSLGYDARRQRLLVPLTGSDRLELLQQ